MWNNSKVLCSESFLQIVVHFFTNKPHVFHVETTWKRLFLRRFNVEYTCFVWSLHEVLKVTQPATSILFLFMFFANSTISSSISERSLLLIKLFVPVCKIIISGFRAIECLIQSFICCVVAPVNDFTTLKYSLREWFKQRLGAFLNYRVANNCNCFLFSSIGSCYVILLSVRWPWLSLVCSFISLLLLLSPTAIELLSSIVLLMFSDWYY